MNKIIRLIPILLGTFTFGTALNAELLVVKKGPKGFMPLDASDNKNAGVISDILKKYQWPMCISNEKLSVKEKYELMSSGNPRAEELFIQNKIKKALPKSQYEVVFIPTALYELFSLLHISENSSNSTNPLTKSANHWYNIDFAHTIDSDRKPIEIRKEINETFDGCNDIFYKKHADQSAALYINNVITKALFKEYSSLKSKKSSMGLSNAIEKNSKNWGKKLLKKGSKFYFNPLWMDELKHKFKEDLNKKKILPKVIDFEYKARKQNKAILLRGSGFEDFQVGIGQSPSSKKLAGTTLLKEYNTYNYLNKQFIPGRFEHAYKNKKTTPYSISFGNSLFAGAINDPGACSYWYLSNSWNPYLKTVGYGLLVDKKDYFDHQCNNLFMIPPLSSIAALAQSGEFFHARVKAATLMPKKRHTPIVGYASWNGLIDKTGVLLITRDPLYHAELFSKYVAENGEMIQVGETDEFSEKEKAADIKLKKAQIKAAKFYKSVKVLTPKLKKIAQKYKKSRCAAAAA